MASKAATAGRSDRRSAQYFQVVVLDFVNSIFAVSVPLIILVFAVAGVILCLYKRLLVMSALLISGCVIVAGTGAGETVLVRLDTGDQWRFRWGIPYQYLPLG